MEVHSLDDDEVEVDELDVGEIIGLDEIEVFEKTMTLVELHNTIDDEVDDDEGIHIEVEDADDEVEVDVEHITDDEVDDDNTASLEITDDGMDANEYLYFVIQALADII